MVKNTRYSLFSLRDMTLFAVIWFTALMLNYVYFDIFDQQSLFDGNYHLKNFVFDILFMMVFIGVSLTLNRVLIRI